MADFGSARDAKAAASRLAIDSGVIRRASQSANLDLSSAYLPFEETPNSHTPSHASYPIEEGSQLEQPYSAECKPINAISKLNLAVQRYCTEPPSVALTYIEQPHQPLSTLHPAQLIRLRLYRYTLKIRITPQVHEEYTTSHAFASRKAAKEAVAQLAIQEGILKSFKTCNSMTTKICRQLGLAVPTRVEDHDPVDEENTSGHVSIAVQKATRNPLAIQCEYAERATESGTVQSTDRLRRAENPIGLLLHGVRMSVKLNNADVRIFEMDPMLRTRKEAKEAVCRLAVRRGLLQDLESHSRNLPTSIIAQSSAIQAARVSAVSRLNTCMQANHATAVTYECHENHNRPATGCPIGPTFSCTVNVMRHGRCIGEFTESNALHSTKQQAKEHIAELAIQQGALSLLAGKAEHAPTDHTTSAADSAPQVSFFSHGSPCNAEGTFAVSTARKNLLPHAYSENLLISTQTEPRAMPWTCPEVFEDCNNHEVSSASISSPPPDRQKQSLNTLAELLPVRDGGLGPPLSLASRQARPEHSSEAIRTLDSVFSLLFGGDGSEAIRPIYELVREEGGSLFGAILTIPLQTQRIFKVDCKFQSKRMAKCQVAQQALDNGIDEDAKAFWLHQYIARKQSDPSAGGLHASDENPTESTGWLDGGFGWPKRRS